MTKDQKQKAIKLINEGAEIGCTTIDEDGKTDVIGTLALGAGVSKEHLHKLGDYGISSTKDEFSDVEEWESLKIIRKAIRETFGLTQDQMFELQDVNDGYDEDLDSDEVKFRREDLAKKINEF